MWYARSQISSSLVPFPTVVSPVSGWVEAVWGSALSILFGFDDILISCPFDLIAVDRRGLFVHLLCANEPRRRSTPISAATPPVFPFAPPRPSYQTPYSPALSLP